MHNYQPEIRKKSSTFIKISTLILIAIASVLFPRMLEILGAPSPINFVHFAIVPGVCGLAIFTTRTRNRHQLSIATELIFGLWLLLTVSFASAWWNGAGAINAILGFLLLAEPIILLLAIVAALLPVKSLARLNNWLNGFVFFHLGLVYIQKFVLNYCDKKGLCDNVQGILYHSGSGHVVGASISATFAVCYFFSAKQQPLWWRSLALIAGLGHIIAADAKQVALVFLFSLVILAVVNLEDLTKAVFYMLGSVVVIALFYWAVNNLDAFSAFNAWNRPELYGADGEATKLKFSGIRIALTYFESPVNWLLGLGPGHTIGRLGGWMIRDYRSLLAPFGVTNAPPGEPIAISYHVWVFVSNSWLAEGSSAFSPFFGWAGIWGDFGFLGLFAYLYLGSIVWRRLCTSNLDKFFLINIFLFGFIFTQLEEPAYMLYVASLIGIRWQDSNRQPQQTDPTNSLKPI
ncbi:hypothetical protein Pse7367_3388 [Thalassoporum mexicanum PCC 7367]|uniref:hypothetical protein n=1 Tax=Thalassoporum mexicanum TaxID=3457544 RepID=UPI00029FEC5F|nr:hypothetical protein [Pseudanabaena sp. PCC 7367]AFY71625.1 hypothetical protein Pse7367_3388 [Pseudanabaena sp. PCC 7367]